MDTYFANVDRTLVDCLVVVGMNLVDVLKLAFHDDKLVVQHFRNLVAHTVALPVDKYLVDNLGLDE